MLVAFLLSNTAAIAQETATDAGSQKPDVPITDRVRDWAENHQLAARIRGEIDGWYPRFGRMTRGAGFAVGPGYRVHPGGGPVLVDVSAGLSTKTYTSVDANVRWFQSANATIALWTDYRFEHFPQEDYFGLGPSSAPDARTSYNADRHAMAARIVVAPHARLRINASVGRTSTAIGPGRDDNFPSIEMRFTDIDAPGLVDQPDYVHSTVSVELDTRDSAGRPATGGVYRVGFGTWNGPATAFDFRRLDLRAHHWVPLSPSKQHVAYWRLGLSRSLHDAAARVPFFAMPYVGGADTVRSLREYRLRGEHAFWGGAEYQYRPIAAMTLALFADAGTVAQRGGDLDLGTMTPGYGFGVGFGTSQRQFGRLDVGFGSDEGRRIFVTVRQNL